MTTKRHILIFLLAFASAVQAQDTFTFERLTNSSGDVIGTARYVGMGGALGALGADMSAISWNPAGIGLYRKSDIAFTFGGLWGKSQIAEEKRGKGTVDQAGFVYSSNIGGDVLRYFNFSFNYQKKMNYNHNFYADNPNLGGLSQMDPVAELTDFDKNDEFVNLAGLAKDNGFFNIGADGLCQNYFGADFNEYTYHGEGSTQAFDFNFSANLKDQFFVGLTFGIDNVRYRGWSLYYEEGHDYEMKVDDNYCLINDYNIKGYGFNLKLGTIVRPLVDNSFRVGFAVETPTWYNLQNSTLFNFGNRISDDTWESFLRFRTSTPWKIRTGIGSTVGSTFAWDIDYEFAAYGSTRVGSYRNIDDLPIGGGKDAAMTQHMRQTLRGTHTLRVGMELNATKNLAFRLGYNLSTSPFEKNVSYDQFKLQQNYSYAMDHATGTSYMRLGNTNILTLGMGYHVKRFYIDLAYKLRNQFGDFYAFDTTFAKEGNPFAEDQQGLANQTIDPVEVNLTRHAITCTLGLKF